MNAATIRPRKGTAQTSVCFLQWLLVATVLQAAWASGTDTQPADWWAQHVPRSGWVPAEENPDFDRYMAFGAPMRKGSDGKFTVDKVVAKGWDKLLRTFYVTLEVDPASPMRVRVPELPSSLTVRSIGKTPDPGPMRFHTDCRVLQSIEGEVLELSGRVGLGVSMDAVGYIVGLPGSRFDISGFTGRCLSLGGSRWRATSEERAFIIVTANEIILENAIGEAVPTTKPTDGGESAGVLTIRSGKITYHLTPVGPHYTSVTPGEWGDVGFMVAPRQYKDDDLACAFSKDASMLLGFALKNLSPQAATVHWGGTGTGIAVGSGDGVAMRPLGLLAFKGAITLSNPFLSRELKGRLEELKEDMLIEPGQAASLLLTGLRFSVDQGKLAAHYELLPSDEDEAKELVGEPLTIFLPPITMGDRRVQKIVEFRIEGID